MPDAHCVPPRRYVDARASIGNPRLLRTGCWRLPRSSHPFRAGANECSSTCAEKRGWTRVDPRSLQPRRRALGMLMSVLGSSSRAVERCNAIEQELFKSQVSGAAPGARLSRRGPHARSGGRSVARRGPSVGIAPAQASGLACRVCVCFPDVPFAVVLCLSGWDGRCVLL